ncbi:hypothetical protein D3C86_1936570 [compost metagenome]
MNSSVKEPEASHRLVATVLPLARSMSETAAPLLVSATVVWTRGARASKLASPRSVER